MLLQYVLSFVELKVSFISNMSLYSRSKYLIFTVFKFVSREGLWGWGEIQMAFRLSLAHICRESCATAKEE